MSGRTYSNLCCVLKMTFTTIWKIVFVVHVLALCLATGSSLPHADFESGWLPIINGLEHVARLNIDHGLGEIPVLVDVSVKVKDFIFPASGFRPDHPVEQSGPVVYLYDDMFVNVSTSPVEDPLYRIVPSVPLRSYTGGYEIFMGTVFIRARAWKLSTLPPAGFHTSGIKLKANSPEASDSYAETGHYLNEIPCLVVVRIHMKLHGDVIIADGVGSSMQVFADVPDRTNAYLVYGYSNTTVRLWVDSSRYGAIFDGRKHTWFDFVISEGEAEIFAWRCSTLTPVYNKRVETKDTLDRVPSWWHVVTGYDMEYSFIRVSIKAEQPGGANEGFLFPGAMHLGYPAPSEEGNSFKPVSVGGLSYTYKTRDKFVFWQPVFDNRSSIFIAESFGGGRNSEISHSESIYIQSWMFEGRNFNTQNTTCADPVIPRGFTDPLINGTSTETETTVHCNDGYVLKPKREYYKHDHEKNTINCHKFGYWENIPRCIPVVKELDEMCNPAEDKCRAQHSTCSIIPSDRVYRCICNNGFRKLNDRCIAQGSYLPNPDYDSGWKSIHRKEINTTSSAAWYYELEHGVGTVPMLVDVQVKVSNNIFQAIGFRADQRLNRGDTSSAVVYVYDEKFINISSYFADGRSDYLLSVKNYKWYGYQTFWSSYGRVRARAWKAESLPRPDIEDNTHVMRANTSTTSDAFYELKHDLNEYPGLVVVRAKMVHDGHTFYANGVGSALSVFYNDSEMTNAFLVYGFSKNSVRIWVDSSESGAIFDGRKLTKFDFFVSEATVEIYAWKISTLTPFFTYKFSLEDLRIPISLTFPVNFNLNDGFNVAVAEITDPSAKNRGFMFPSAAYMSDRYLTRDDKKGGACTFGGFTYAFDSKWIYWTYTREVDMNMLLYKPRNFSHPYSDTGSLLCIPETFGNGEYSEAAFNGVGTFYSWFQADCGPPPDLDHGHINTTVNGTEVGTVAHARCSDGYRLSGNTMPQCTNDYPQGIAWVAYISCLPVECGTVEAPLNGTMNATSKTFGGKVAFECDTGYKLDGAEILECLSSGNWSADTPVCNLVECGTVEAPLNGTMNATVKTFGGKVAFECDTGYKRDGAEILECLSSGNWSADTPVCNLVAEKEKGVHIGAILGPLAGGIVVIITIVCLAWYCRKRKYSDSLQQKSDTASL